MRIREISVFVHLIVAFTNTKLYQHVPTLHMSITMTMQKRERGSSKGADRGEGERGVRKGERKERAGRG